MQEVFSMWLAMHPVDASAGEDVEMDGAEPSGADPATQVEDLRQCYEQYRVELEANPWCRSVLAGL